MTKMTQEEKEDRIKAIQDVKLLMANDWNIKEETPQMYVLTKNTATLGGHILVLIFLGWWTFGVANLIYHLASYKKKKVIK